MKIGSQRFGMLKNGQKKITKLFHIGKKAVPKKYLGTAFFYKQGFFISPTI